MESILFKHFWLICGLWTGLGNAGYFWFRLKNASKEGKIEKRKVDKIVLKIALCIFIPCFILWLTQIFFESNSPIVFMDEGIAGTLATIIAVLCWISLFSWIWFFGGAKALAEILPLAGYRFKFYQNPNTYKIGIILLLAVSSYSLVVQRTFLKGFNKESNKTVVEELPHPI